MSRLSVTLIDVGWGDSILIESEDNAGNCSYALIDSNDSANVQSSYIYLKRFFQKKGIDYENNKPVFDFVLLSHAHSDHGQGLKKLLREFGTRRFWYPKSIDWTSLISLIRYSNRSSNVVHHEAVNNDQAIHGLGDVDVEFLWPPHDQIDNNNENNNSVVLLLTLNGISVVLGGDAEKEVWNNISNDIPDSTRFFKVPHHGSVNGTFDGANTPWFDNCPDAAILGISSHISPFEHPDEEVISLFEDNGRTFFRTDDHYHITFRTDGNSVEVKYSDFETIN